jgi:hypothetical protein
MEPPPGASPGARIAPGDDLPTITITYDDSRYRKFRPLLSTEGAEWDTEERGCALPVALLLVAFLVVYVCYAIVAYT